MTENKDGFACPRRPYVNMEVFNYPTTDHWNEDDTCSWCGSLNPEKALALIKSGTTIEPTDKRYKIYLQYGPHNMQKFYFPHFSQQQITEFATLYLEGKIKMTSDFYSGLPFKFDQKV